MKHKIDDHTKPIIVLILATLAIIVYMLSIRAAYTVFQNTKLADPLASISSLFPAYYIAVALMAGAIFACIIYRIRSRGVHFFLLIAFATMLWFTPYYLAGFVYQPDGPWHVGAALQIPGALSGDSLWYSQTYPGSYIFHYAFINITGMEPLLYISKFFPFVRLCLFILLAYVFISSMFGSQVAFLSSALIIPGLHYTQLHPSPASIGLILVFTVLTLFMKTGMASRVLTFLLILTVVATHPVSPLSLLIFLGAAFVTSFLKKLGRRQIILAAMIIICLAGWFFWPIFTLTATEKNLASAITETGEEVVSDINRLDLSTTRRYLLSSPFLYSDIYNLNKAIYLIYLLLATVLILYIVIPGYLRRRSFKRWISGLGGLSYNQIFLAVSLPIFLLLTFLLAEQTHDLIERGLTYIILVLSGLIASILLNLLSKPWVKNAVPVLLLFLTMSFPLVSYSIDAYTSFPQSEKAGLEFLSAGRLDENKIIVGNNMSQLLLYGEHMQIRSGRVNEVKVREADIIALRNTGYYYTSLRFDFSFHNSFTRLREQINTGAKFNKIYKNPTFELYEKNISH